MKEEKFSRCLWDEQGFILYSGVKVSSQIRCFVCFHVLVIMFALLVCFRVRGSSSNTDILLMNRHWVTLDFHGSITASMMVRPTAPWPETESSLEVKYLKSRILKHFSLLILFLFLFDLTLLQSFRHICVLSCKSSSSNSQSNSEWQCVSASQRTALKLKDIFWRITTNENKYLQFILAIIQNRVVSCVTQTFGAHSLLQKEPFFHFFPKIFQYWNYILSI